MTTTNQTTTLKSEDGRTHEYRVEVDGRLSISVVADHFESYDWCPEGYGCAGVEYGDKDDTYSWHESPQTLFFRPLPPPVRSDTAPLTHKIRFTCPVGP